MNITQLRNAWYLLRNLNNSTYYEYSVLNSAKKKVGIGINLSGMTLESSTAKDICGTKSNGSSTLRLCIASNYKEKLLS